jgi:hypothetical protein
MQGKIEVSALNAEREQYIVGGSVLFCIIMFLLIFKTPKEGI